MVDELSMRNEDQVEQEEEEEEEEEAMTRVFVDAAVL